MGKWSKERIWEWYNARPWYRGCNFMPSNCANRIDMYQNYQWDEHFACAEEELALAQRTGFNTVRLIHDFVVWREEHDDYLRHIEAYVDLCDRYGMGIMFVLANDCVVPKDDKYKEPHVGPQHFDIGYHGGRKHSQHQQHATMGFSVLDVPETRALYYEYVREMITLYKDDPRVIIWDLFNEPGNSGRYGVSLPYLKDIFEIAREIDPIQPLTAGTFRFGWSMDLDSDERLVCDKFCVENSDIISYHCYGDLERNVKIIHALQKYGRPILNTEWLARPTDSFIQTLFPLFFLNKVGCYNWGFVAGKYQTFEPWNGVWQQYEEGGARDFDFRLWFHDLYRPSLRPYDPKEIELIRRFCDLADKDQR